MIFPRLRRCGWHISSEAIGAYQQRASNLLGKKRDPAWHTIKSCIDMYRYVSMELRISKTHHWKPTEGPPLSCMNPLGISLQDHLLNFQGANLRLKAHVQHSIRLIQDQKPGANHDEPRWDSVISHRSGKQNNMWVMTIGRYYPVSWWIFTDMFDSQNEPGPRNVQPAGTIQLKSGWWITFGAKKSQDKLGAQPSRTNKDHLDRFDIARATGRLIQWEIPRWDGESPWGHCSCNTLGLIWVNPGHY